MNVRLKVPATSANLGPGFDCLGVALDFWNEVEAEFLPGQGSPAISIEGEGAAALPADETHLLWATAARYVRDRGGEMPRLRLRCLNRIPLARGLGSSAAALVAGVMLGQFALHGNSDPQELLTETARLEGHPDNVAPAVLGGLVASLIGRSAQVLATVRPLHRCWRLVVAVPDFQLETSVARKALPQHVTFHDAVENLMRLPLLLAGLEEGRADWVCEASRDVLHQPYRVPLVPGLEQVMESAVRNGAAAAYLSGAGPTVAAWVDERSGDAERVAACMREAWAERGIGCRERVLMVSSTGAHRSG